MTVTGRPPLPDPAAQEYLWWSAGAADEAKARDEGLNCGARQLRDLLEGLARLHPGEPMEALATRLARIACPGRLRRRFR